MCFTPNQITMSLPHGILNSSFYCWGGVWEDDCADGPPGAQVLAPPQREPGHKTKGNHNRVLICVNMRRPGYPRYSGKRLLVSDIIWLFNVCTDFSLKYFKSLIQKYMFCFTSCVGFKFFCPVSIRTCCILGRILCPFRYPVGTWSWPGIRQSYPLRYLAKSVWPAYCDLKALILIFTSRFDA